MEKKEDRIQEKIQQLIGQIQGMPEPQRSRLMELARETQERHEQLKATFAKIHEGVDHLRLHVKYLLFDLEATRRENQQLKNMLRGK
ncbi:MAG: hypothetical protein GXY33_08040 [Phycisphaerae bacterium]|nr:hypothetical protein [Phycisphaerae bacterium]